MPDNVAPIGGFVSKAGDESGHTHEHVAEMKVDSKGDGGAWVNSLLVSVPTTSFPILNCHHQVIIHNFTKCTRNSQVVGIDIEVSLCAPITGVRGAFPVKWTRYDVTSAILENSASQKFDVVHIASSTAF